MIREGDIMAEVSDLQPTECYDMETGKPIPPKEGMMISTGNQMQFTQWLQLCEFVNEEHPRKIRADRSTARNVVYQCGNTDGGTCPFCVKLQRHKDKSWKVTHLTQHQEGCTSTAAPSAKILRILLGCAALNGASAKHVMDMAQKYGYKLKGKENAMKQMCYRAIGKAKEVTSQPAPSSSSGGTIDVAVQQSSGAIVGQAQSGMPPGMNHMRVVQPITVTPMQHGHMHQHHHLLPHHLQHHHMQHAHQQVVHATVHTQHRPHT